MMIQNFMFQGISNTGNKSGKSVRNDSKGSNSDFSKILDMKNKAENRVEKSSNDLTKGYEVQSNTRRINVKEEKSNTKEKDTIQESDTTKSKKEEAIDELIQSVNGILVMLQNLKDLNLENLEDLSLEGLNLEVSVEGLENLKIALENIVSNLNLEESNLPMQETIKNIEDMINSVYKNGDIEVDAENFLLDLKKVISLIESEGNNEKSLIENEEGLENLKKLINFIKEPNVDNQSKVNMINKEELIVESKQSDIKVKVTSNENDKLENMLEDETENIILDDSLDEIKVNIKEDKVNIEKIISNELTNMQTNIQVNNQQSIDVSKNTLNIQQYLELDKSDIIKQVTNKVKADYDSQINEIKVKLSPEHLGNLTIKVTLERGIITARAIVENLNVKQMLESNISELKDSLKEQGINFESIDVSVGQDQEHGQGNSHAFAKNKNIKVPKINIDNSNSMNLYEDIEENLQGQNSSVGEGNLDITI